MNYDFSKLSVWIEKKVARIKYGELVIRVKLHDGQVREISKTVEEKERNVEDRDKNSDEDSMV